ncbi:MAG: DUF1289 domain-containing protein [Pseudomonadota bacterium]
MNDIHPESPCVSICVLDEDNICQGCYRSAEEIADWLMAGAIEKQAIINRASARKEQSFGVPAGLPKD